MAPPPPPGAPGLSISDGASDTLGWILLTMGTLVVMLLIVVLLFMMARLRAGTLFGGDNVAPAPAKPVETEIERRLREGRETLAGEVDLIAWFDAQTAAAKVPVK